MKSCWVANTLRLMWRYDIFFANTSYSLTLIQQQHHERSYQGFTCLVQISTDTEDFLIDAIKLRSSMHKLNDCFTNPKILKIMHGLSFRLQFGF